MKFAVMGTLTFNTTTKRDTVYSKLETFLSGKAIWGNTVLSKGEDMLTKQPAINIQIRFNQKPDMQNLFDLTKTELNKLTGVKAIFSKHVCNHDTNNSPCVIEALATIVR